jgi:hypothetical protein
MMLKRLKTMSQKHLLLKSVLATVFLAIVSLLTAINAPAQSGSETRAVHNACSGNCVVDGIFLHSSMGDRMAKNAYHGWFDSYYALAGCGDAAWKNDIIFLIDVVGDMVGAPGAPTLQCWQGLMGQASLCSDSCSEYFIPDLKYAPNVRLSLDWGEPGQMEVSLDNQSNLGKVPELQPNAYSRGFHLLTTLQLGDGTPVLVNDLEMPSLSFPNWITRGGYSDCLMAYGLEDNRCKLIEKLTTPSVVSTAIEFQDGVFYDLTDQIDDLSDASGSFDQDGFIRLLSNGDSITINQGDFSGYLWVKTHNRTDGEYTQQLIPWDVRGGSLTIVNRECNSWLSTCWVTGDRTETDTYVFALQGPDEKRLPGTYTVQVTADIPHEKDFSDNRSSYSYDASEISGQLEGTQENDESQGQEFEVKDLPIIDLPGPGIYPNNIPGEVQGAMFRLPVPQGIHFMFLQLASLDGSQFSFFVRRGSLPVPDFPVINYDYHCWEQSALSYSGGCPFTNPYPEAYYIFVNGRPGSSFQIEVEFTTSADAATQVTQQTQEAETEGELVDPGESFSEVEKNDERATANSWDLQQPFSGQISRWGDRDYVFLNIIHPGIYTFTLSETGPDIQGKITLVRASNGNFLDSSKASIKGESTSLTFDASAGEQYDLIVSAQSMTSGATNQAYQLSLTGFIPDPHESNDDRGTSTFWDLSQAPIQGYFWDKTTGRADYIRFIAPQTQEGTAVNFELTNPSPDLRIRMTLLNAQGLFQENTPYSPPGHPLVYSKILEANHEYYLKLETLNLGTSQLPYTLSASFVPGSTATDSEEIGRPVRIHGLVYNQGSFLPRPIRDANIYVQVEDQPLTMLDTTGIFGNFSGTVRVVESQEVRIWAVKEGFMFQPEEDSWIPDGRTRSHRVVFTVVGAQLIQETLTPIPDTSGTAVPPLIQTALASPKPTDPFPATPRPATATLEPTTPTTNLSTATPEPAAATRTPTDSQSMTLISGSVWRLFPDSDPAGVGAAQVVLTVNGVDQPAALTLIDGSYSISVPDLRPGDQLALRAENPEDEFEPLTYQWNAEAGVERWSFDFYSYWGTITPPDRDDQNRIFGRVIDAQDHGVPGVYLILRMGNSDALQRFGPTDANGFFEAYVRLPNRIMATIWVEQPGFLPSQYQFFHAYAAEDREIIFRQQSLPQK